MTHRLILDDILIYLVEYSATHILLKTIITDIKENILTASEYKRLFVYTTIIY